MNTLQTIIEAAHSGGNELRAYFGQTLNPIEKSTVWDLQTEADLASEKQILSVLTSNFPTYNIHSEEDGKQLNGSEFTIVIDPLDGTNNFVLGIPNFSVSIAVLKNNEAIAAVVYQPMLNQTFTAEKGNGAYVNGNLLRVNDIRDPKKLTISYNCGYTTPRDQLAREVAKLTNRDHKRILFNWSPAFDYCLLASGKIESVITNTIEIYDFGAGKLIALEAGADIVNFNGTKEQQYNNPQFVASNSPEVNAFITSGFKD